MAYDVVQGPHEKDKRCPQFPFFLVLSLYERSYRRVGGYNSRAQARGQNCSVGQGINGDSSARPRVVYACSFQLSCFNFCCRFVSHCPHAFSAYVALLFFCWSGALVLTFLATFPKPRYRYRYYCYVPRWLLMISDSFDTYCYDFLRTTVESYIRVLRDKRGSLRNIYLLTRTPPSVQNKFG